MGLPPECIQNFFPKTAFRGIFPESGPTGESYRFLRKLFSIQSVFW